MKTKYDYIKASFWLVMVAAACGFWTWVILTITAKVS